MKGSNGHQSGPQVTSAPHTQTPSLPARRAFDAHGTCGGGSTKCVDVDFSPGAPGPWGQTSRRHHSQCASSSPAATHSCDWVPAPTARTDAHTQPQPGGHSLVQVSKAVLTYHPINIYAQNRNLSSIILDEYLCKFYGAIKNFPNTHQKKSACLWANLRRKYSTPIYHICSITYNFLL